MTECAISTVRGGERVLFFGTVAPHVQTLKRLVHAAIDGSVSVAPADAEVHTLPACVAAFQTAGLGDPLE